MYLQREDVKKKLETIVDRHLLGRHEEAIVTNISLSKSQQGKVLESLEKQLSEYESLNSDLDLTMEDRVRARTFHDSEKPADRYHLKLGRSERDSSRSRTERSTTESETIRTIIWLILSSQL